MKVSAKLATGGERVNLGKARTVTLTGMVAVGLSGSSVVKITLPLVVSAVVEGEVRTTRFKTLFVFGTVVPELRLSVTKLDKLLDN